MSVTELEDLQRQSGLVGEDAAVFSFQEQSLKSWGSFLAVLGTVLTALYYLWLNPDTGYGELFSPIRGLFRQKRPGAVCQVSSRRRRPVVPTQAHQLLEILFAYYLHFSSAEFGRSRVLFMLYTPHFSARCRRDLLHGMSFPMKNSSARSTQPTSPLCFCVGSLTRA